MTDEAIESQAADFARGVANLRHERDNLAQSLAIAERTCAKLESENLVLREQIKTLAAKADYHMRWNAELVTQVNNIGMFAQDAMEKAKVGPYRAQGQREQLEAVAKALEADLPPEVPKFLTQPREAAIDAAMNQVVNETMNLRRH